MIRDKKWIREKNNPFFTYFRILVSYRTNDEIPLDFFMIQFLRKFATNEEAIDNALTATFQRSNEYKNRHVDIKKITKGDDIPEVFNHYASRGRKLSPKLCKACKLGDKSHADIQNRIRYFLQEHLPLKTKGFEFALKEIQELIQELQLSKELTIKKLSELDGLIQENRIDKTVDYFYETFQLVLDAEYDSNKSAEIFQNESESETNDELICILNTRYSMFGEGEDKKMFEIFKNAILHFNILDLIKNPPIVILNYISLDVDLIYEVGDFTYCISDVILNEYEQSKTDIYNKIEEFTRILNDFYVYLEMNMISSSDDNTWIAIYENKAMENCGVIMSFHQYIKDLYYKIPQW